MSPSRQTSAAAIGVSHHKCQGRAGKKKCILRFAAAALDERTFSSNGRVIVCRAEISREEFADVRGAGFPVRIAFKCYLLSTFFRHRLNCFIPRILNDYIFLHMFKNYA